MWFRLVSRLPPPRTLHIIFSPRQYTPRMRFSSVQNTNTVMLRSAQSFLKLKHATKLSRLSILTSPPRAMLPHSSSNQISPIVTSRAVSTDASVLSSDYDQIMRTNISSFSNKLGFGKSYLTKVTAFFRPSISSTAPRASSSTNQVPSISRSSSPKHAAKLACPLISCATPRAPSSPNKQVPLIATSNFSSDCDQIIHAVSSSPPVQGSLGIGAARNAIQSNCYQYDDESIEYEDNDGLHDFHHHESYFERNSESCSLVGW
mmetsp:Transcript_14964/g.32266  ORF Transcript_14964/g.32266 Transcript_14964/m.32266 type:complete len:261 (-) Transcript_14964:102-884(-)